MEITSKTLYQEQQKLKQGQQKLKQGQQRLKQEQQKLGRAFIAAKNDMIKWVVGLFIGTIIVITSSVGVYAAFVLSQV